MEISDIPHRLRPDVPILKSDSFVGRQFIRLHRLAGKGVMPSLTLWCDKVLHEDFDLSNQHREIGVREAHLRRRNAVMLDVR